MWFSDNECVKWLYDRFEIQYSLNDVVLPANVFGHRLFVHCSVLTLLYVVFFFLLLCFSVIVAHLY